jgi:ligand-binding sensor domain-containing protein
MGRIRVLLLAVIALGACRPGVPSAIPTPAVTTPRLTHTSTAPPPSTPTSRPEPPVLEGPFRLVAPVPPEAIADLMAEIRLDLSTGAVRLLSAISLTEMAGFGWETVVADFPGVPAGIDDRGRVWVILQAGDGIAVWDDEAWRLFAAESGWSPLAEARGMLTVDAAGGMWLATGEDVRRFDGETWSVFPPEAMGMDPADGGDTRASFLVQPATAMEAVWVGECDLIGPGPAGGQGARWYDGSAWRGADSPASSGCSLAVEEDPRGAVWVGVDDRLWSYDPAGRTWSELDLPPLGDEGRPGPFILDLAFGPRGDLWALVAICGGASCSGNEVLLQRAGEVWRQMGEAGEFSAAPVFDASGTAWLPTRAGVYQVEGGEPVKVGDLEVVSATVDADGRLWLAAWRGGDLGVWAQVHE